MKRYVILAGVAAASLLSASVPAWSAQSASAAATAGAKPKAMYGGWGIDLAGMDVSVKPGDNFYEHVNGKWIKGTQIPADQSSWGGFTQLGELSDERVRLVIEEAAKSNAAPGTNARKISDFYNSFMDEAAIEAKGVAPLKPHLAKIDAIKTQSDLARAFGESVRRGSGSPFSGGVSIDVKNNEQHVVSIGQGGLGLPDRDYYLDEKNPKFVQIRAAYQSYVANMLRLAGISEPEARAARIYAIEKKIAEAHWPLTELRQADKTYNPMSRAELEKNIPGFEWSTYLTTLGLGDAKRLIVRTPSSLNGSAKLVQSEPIETWKDYLTFRTINSVAPVLPKAFVEENFRFRKTLSGAPQLAERWKRGVGLVGNGMGEAVGQLYVARFYPPEAKAKMDVLVANLIKAMDKRLDNLSWMTPETRAKAKTKLASFVPVIGVPPKWRDYSALQIVAGDALGNSLRGREFEFNRNLKKLGQPVDRDEWPWPPQTVNAWASFAQNKITFPAAIIQPPFFDMNADDAVNYGAIGSVIGHEISHHFDDQGRKYDPKGNLIDWWAPSDVAAFKAGADKVVKQYAGYEIFPGQKVNGELTLGENIADLAGLTIAYDAYKESLRGKPAPVIDGFTGEQRFFLGFAQAWRSKQRDEYAKHLLTIDYHSPDRVRPNVVRNFDPWYEAFNVKDGALYLPPEERIRIW